MNASTTRFRRLIVIALVAVLAMPALAQDSRSGSGDTAPLRVEDVYLQSAVSVETIASQIRTGGRDIRLIAIRSIEAQINSGIVDPADQRLFDALVPAVNEGVFTINHTVQRSLHIYDPMVRREAVRVMGLLGTTQAQGKLVGIILNDPEPQVRAEALRGIGLIAYDPEGEVSRAIARVILRERATNPHQESVLAAVNALGAIARIPENTLHPSAQEMLVHVASDGMYIQLVRKHAMLTLSQM